MAGDRGSDVLDCKECHTGKDVGKGKQNILLDIKIRLSTGPGVQKHEASLGTGWDREHGLRVVFGDAVSSWDAKGVDPGEIGWSPVV